MLTKIYFIHLYEGGWSNLIHELQTAIFFHAHLGTSNTFSQPLKVGGIKTNPDEGISKLGLENLTLHRGAKGSP